MPRCQKDFMVDVNLQLKDAGAVAASAAATVGGVARILDMGLARFDGRAIVDISACNVAAGDLAYVLAQVSNSATFATGVFVAAAALFGDATVNYETVDTAVPRRQEIALTNEISGTTYRYVRLWTVIAAAGSINYTAWLVQDA